MPPVPAPEHPTTARQDGATSACCAPGAGESSAGTAPEAHGEAAGDFLTSAGGLIFFDDVVSQTHLAVAPSPTPGRWIIAVGSALTTLSRDQAQVVARLLLSDPAAAGSEPTP